MSRPKRRLDPATMTAEEADHLLTGFSFTRESPFESPEVRRATWQAHREDLLLYWTGQPVELDVDGSQFWGSRPEGPGHRPRAWWQYEAPEVRQVTDADRLCEYQEARPGQPDDSRSADWWAQQASGWDGDTYLGVPKGSIEGGPRYFDGSSYGFASQAEYLDRLDLLSPWERQELELDN